MCIRALFASNVTLFHYVLLILDHGPSKIVLQTTTNGKIAINSVFSGAIALFGKLQIHNPDSDI